MFDDLDDEVPPTTTDPHAPLEMPTGGPQFENDTRKSIMVLLDEAPAFDGAFAPELLVLFRNHIALRSMLGLLLEKAQQSLNQLRVEESNKLRSRLQGEIKALEETHVIITNMLTAAEQAQKDIPNASDED